MYQLHLFGTLELHDATAAPVRLFTKKAGYLLAYLWCHRAQPQPRERVAGLFWPESPDPKARHSLTQALHHLRKALQETDDNGQPLLMIGHSTVQFNPQATCQVDAALMDQALEALQRAPDEAALPQLRAAVEAYRGPFVDGCYDDWCLEERDRFQDGYLSLLRALASQLADQGQLEPALDCLKRVLATVPWDEETHRQLMQAYHLLDRRSDALKQYQVCQRVLDEEFGMPPDDQTRALHEKILNTPQTAKPLVVAKRARPAIGPVQAPGRFIAVLPFVDLSPKGDQAYFSDGLTEDLIGALTRVRALRVISRSSSFALKGTALDLREIGQRLKVNTVLEGSVRTAGKRVRIAARLNQVEPEALLWSESYDRKLDDIFAVQDEITRAIVNALKIKLLGRGERGLTRPTSDQAAYHHYLRGRYFWNQRTQDDLARSIGCFEHAIEADAGYARAYSGLADAYSVLGYYHFAPRGTAFAQAKEAAQRALELDETLAEAHLSLGLVCDYHWAWAQASAAYRRALQLNPGSATAHHWYALYLMNQGQFDEAQQAIDRAHTLDPLSLAVHRDFGQVLYYAGDHASALRYLLDTVEMNPQFPLTHLYLGLVRLQLGDRQGARAAFEIEDAVSGTRERVGTLMLAYVDALEGDADEAKRRLEALSPSGEAVFVPPYFVALVHFALDQKDQAIKVLARAHGEHDFWLSRLKIDPLMVERRNDPALAGVLKQFKGAA